MEDVESVRVNLPNGLCVRGPGCKDPSTCGYCCSVNDECYISVNECKVRCSKSSHLDPTAAMNLAPSSPV